MKDMLEEIDTSSSWILENVSSLKNILEAHGSTSGANYTLTSLQRCNIRLVSGANMKTSVHDFLQSLYDVVPNSIGNKLPDDDFYYQAD